MYSTLVAFFFFSITLSFLCSLWEAVLLSITPTYAQVKLSEGSEIGKQLQLFKQKIDEPLAAILTLNTFAHTVGAIGVGEQATLIWYDSNPLITGVVVPLAMTMAILILSEIIPKTIGANFWKELSPFTIYSLRIVIKVIYPLVWMCQLITKSFRKENRSVFSRSDFIAMAELGAEQGIFNVTESDIIENALDLSDVRVKQVMRHKSDMISISNQDSMLTIMETVRKYRYSRYPVYDPQTNDIIGVIHAKELLIAIYDGRITDNIESIIRPILKVSATLPAMDLLRKLREGMPHFALVYENRRDLVGFITFDNLLHAIFGLIKDEFNKTQEDWIRQPDGTFIVKGKCSIFALERALDSDITLLETEEEMDTIASLIVNRSGKTPAYGTVIEFAEFNAVIEDVHNDNIVMVRVIPKDKG